MIKRWISIVTVLFLIVANIPQYAFAGSLDAWTIRSPLPTGNELNNVAYGNGIYVAVGANGAILTSTDGTNWTSRTSGAPITSLNDVVYGNGKFVVVGNSGKILTSIDGSSWTTQDSTVTNSLNGIVYGNGVFLAVGDTGRIVTSPNGTDWTARPNSNGSALYEVTYGNGMYVAVGANGTIMTSNNLTTWTKVTNSTTTNSLSGVTYGNSLFVAVGVSGTVVTSNNGTSWTNRTIDTTTYMTDVTYVNGMYVAVDYYGLIVASSNGTSWTSQASGFSGRLYAVVYGNGMYVAVGATMLTSTNGTSWTNLAVGPRGHFYGEVYGNGMYVAVGFSGAIETSVDGANWTTRSSGTTSILNGVTYGNGAYVAVGNAGTILTSNDGASWTSRTSGLTNALRGVAYANGAYVVVGDMGGILTSSDGVQWTSQTSGSTNAFSSVTYGNGAYVAVGAGGQIFTSGDGVSWMSQTSGTANYLYGVAYGGGTYVAVGNLGTILTSSDGANWTKQTNASSNILRGVTYGNGTYAAVGDSGTIVASSDAINWASRTSGVTSILYGVAFGNGTYVAVGASGTVLQSDVIAVAPAINSVSVSPSSASVAQGGSKQLAAAVTAVGGAADTVLWTSSDAGNKVTVDGTGNVTVAADAAPADYTITATSTFDSSKKGTATITVTAAMSREATPTADVDYAAEQLTGLVTNGAYTVIGTAMNADASGKIAIEDSWLGAAVYVVKKGNGTTTTDSLAQTLALPGRPDTPNAGKTDESSINGSNGTLTNVTPAMAYKKAADSNWTDITGMSMTGLAPGTYTVRVKATASSFASAAQTVTIAAFVATQEAQPEAEVDYAAEQLTGLVANGTYGVNGTLVTADGNGKIAIENSWLDEVGSLLKKGNGTTTTDSLAQTLALPGRPDTPNAGKSDESSINGSNGTLTNVTSAMAYKQAAASSWTDITGTSVTGLAPGTYNVRVKATASSFASAAQTVTISAFVATQEAQPEAEVDYAAEQLTGLAANGAYTVNGTTMTADGSGKLQIDASWLGTDVNVVKKGNGLTTTDSLAQTRSLPGRPATPTAGKTDESSINGSNGTLTNVTSAMAYKQAAASSWTDITGTSVTGLAPATYNVRVKATASSFASAAQTVTISAFVATQEAQPEAEVDYAAEQLTGLVANGAYTVNGTAMNADSNGNIAIEDSWLGGAVYLVKKGDGTTTTDSLAQTLALPGRPDTPTAGKTDESTINGNNGTLTNVTPAMAYKKAADSSWTDIVGTSVTGLAPGTYAVRVKATASSFASEAQTVTIAAFNATKELKPTADVDYAAEQLTGLVANGAYTVNGTEMNADASGKIAIEDSWLGAAVYVIKKGNGTTTTDSLAQTLALPARPAAPVDISVTDVTYKGANNGSILDLNLGMEIKEGNNGTWTKSTGTSVVGLAPSTYYVRIAATASSFASIPAQVTIHDTDATLPAAPDVSADDASNVIVGLDTTMEYSVDGGAYVRYDGTNMPQLSGEHTVLVRVAASGSVPAGPATTLIFTTNMAVPAGGLTVTATDPSGAANDGKTMVTVTPLAGENHRLVYFNFGSGTVEVPNVGDTLSGYSNVPSDRMIPAANGDKLGIAEVDAQGQVVRFGQAAAIVIAEPTTSQPSNETPTGTAGPKEESIDVLVNGKVENAGKATTTESGGVKTTTVAVDPVKLQAKLDAEGANAVVTIPVKSASNVIVGELNGRMVKNMENLSATLVLQTEKGTYTLPAKQINIDALAGKFGSGVKLEDIQLKVTIAQTPDTMAKVVENAASKGEFSVVVPAVDFTVSGSNGGKTVEVTTFNAYVERMVALPDGIDPNRITTGVVVDADGTTRHVPTKIVLIEGKYYAKMNSLTNSTYTVVWHPLEFSDVANHWAKAAVNDMGSRMVIEGTGGGLFSPNRDITRAEFAAIIVRALGLKPDHETTPFADVKTSDWYSDAVNTAYAYHLIAGFEDGTFRPNDNITREQAMAVLSNAMKLTGLKDKLPVQSADAALLPFTDGASVSSWAKSSVADSVQAGIVAGRSAGSAASLAPKANMTRAEVAVIIRNLLQRSDLI
ncbi:S-layer homology domain-containing protein [Cohnella sp. GCM10012308]|uniref:S-layer homology domain-containing protein n=1 Tax=Cohnella sp. GCM10012308 TaxID=3317329 RepID=UPI003610271C